MEDLAVCSMKVQTPILTIAHEGLISHIINNYDNRLFILGSNRIITRVELFEYEWRKEMIKDYIIENFGEHELEACHFIELFDVYNIDLWCKNVDELIFNFQKKQGKFYSVTLVGGRDSFLDSYCGIYTNKDYFKSAYGDDVSASNLRNNIDYINDPMFRKGMLFQAFKRQYATAFSTVDIAVIDGKGNVLLGRRSWETKYRFIGGVSEPSEKSHEASAIKELKEEANIDGSEENLRYIGSLLMNDPRHANKQDSDKFKTVLYTYYYDSEFKMGDDMDGDMKWFNISEVDIEQDIIPVHQELFKMFKNKCYNLDERSKA